MVTHKWTLGIGLLCLLTFMSCGKPAPGEKQPVRNNGPAFSTDAQAAVEEVQPVAPVATESAQERGESLEETKAAAVPEKIWASEVPVHDYIGAKKCSLCHNKAAKGDQYQIWKGSAHANAFQTLGTPEAKAVADALGIADPQQSGKCLRCHSTAYAFGEQKVTDIISVEEGVSCETCHGPGKDYMKLEAMKDREKAVAAGLIIPDEQTCLKCHNDTAPNVKPFHFQELWDKIKHLMP